MIPNLRMNFLGVVQWSLAVCFVLTISSCATTQQTRSAKLSGFLKDYSQLREGKGEEAQLVYINPDANFSVYDKIMLDPITIWRSEGSNLSEIAEEDLQQLVDYLYSTIQEHLKNDYTFVKQPGPKVMHFRIAITEAKGSQVTLGIVSSVVPQMSVVSQVKKLTTGTHSFVGKAAVECEVLDSLSNKRLAAFVDERAGTRALRSKGGTWNDVQGSYDFWANRLKTRLAELSTE